MYTAHREHGLGDGICMFWWPRPPVSNPVFWCRPDWTATSLTFFGHSEKKIAPKVAYTLSHSHYVHQLQNEPLEQAHTRSITRWICVLLA